MANLAIAERRSNTRYPSQGLFVGIRRKGRLHKLDASAQDFNKFGVAVLLDQPLPKDCTVYLTVASGDLKIDNLIGVVHNCISQRNGYRCGIQFRTQSNLQFDQEQVECTLRQLEARFKVMMEKESERDR
ncbi:MAG: hypothetical protein AAF541_16020 [Pseudomonadota bacterium]